MPVQLSFTSPLIFIFVSFVLLLHGVVGELVPKRLGIQRAEKVVLFVGPPLRFFYRMAKPVIVSFTSLANWILEQMGLREEEETALSEEELKMVVHESHE